MSGQITAYLPAREAEEFKAYASALGLDKSSLANLLLTREACLERLAALVPQRHGRPVAECTKVTAHAVSERTRAHLASAAKRLGVGMGVAAAMVFRAELRERWLERAMQMPDSDRVAD